MAANIEVLGTAAREFLNRSRALLDEENHHPVDISSVRAIERDLQLSIVAIRQYYNESPFAPIHRLHPELLGMIFQHIREPSKIPSPARPEYYGRFDSYKPLLAPMLVCQRWHKLVTEDPALWCEIDFEKKGLVQHLLSRSKAASLDVRFPYPGFVKDGRKMLTLLLKNHGGRFRKLEVELQKAERTANLLPLLNISMPRLTCLVLSLSKPDKEKGLPKQNVHAMSFAKFPSLKALALARTVLCPKEPIPSLTHLHLICLENDSIDPLMDLLRAASRLEVLDLAKIKLDTPDVGSKVSRLILPRLRTLRITDGCLSEVVNFLLLHLKAPNLARADIMNVNFWGGSGEMREYIPRCNLLKRAMTRSRFKCTGRSFTAVFESAEFRLKIKEGCRVLKSVLDTPPMLDYLSGIEEACLDWSTRDEYRYDGKDGPWLVARMPNLQSFVVDNAQYGLRLLEQTDPILFPALVSFTLDASEACKDELEGMVRAVEQRAKTVGPLPVFRIAGYSDKKSKLAGVRKNVGTLEFVQSRSTKEILRSSMGYDSCSEIERVDDHAYWTDADNRTR